jgi:hypothetical protein
MHPAARENDKISGCPPVRSHLPKGDKTTFLMMHASDQTTAEYFTITLIAKVQNASTAWESGPLPHLLMTRLPDPMLWFYFSIRSQRACKDH